MGNVIMVVLGIVTIACVALLLQQRRVVGDHEDRIDDLEQRLRELRSERHRGGESERARPAEPAREPGPAREAEPAQDSEPARAIERRRPAPRPAVPREEPDEQAPATAPMGQVIDDWHRDTWADEELRRFTFKEGHRPGDRGAS